MQLKNIKGQMSVAACALLQVAAPVSEAADNDTGNETRWDIDSSVLIYSESDGRVSAFEPGVRVGIDLGDDEFVNLQIVADALTGATPNGAHKSTVVQTFTTPSGNTPYTVQPGELPKSTTFRDSRVALTAEWDKPLTRLSSVLLGASLSDEIDYTSLSLSGTYEHEMNNKNTTLAAGLATTFDTINPIGGIPLGLNPMRQAGSAQQRVGTDDTRTSVDLILGVTQVIDRKTLMQFNYTHGSSSGYHNDYNNVLTVYDPVTNAPLVGDWLTLDANDMPYLFEKRPDSRSKDIFFVRAVHHLEEDVINLSYRFYTDDWGITSHTLDLRYRYQMDGSYLVPHLRYYTQTGADFYRHNLKVDTDIDRATGAVNVDFASNDYRLAPSDTVTVGLKYGLPLSDDSEFSMRAEVMTQTITDSTVPAGEETPGLDAIILQFNYSLLW